MTSTVVLTIGELASLSGLTAHTIRFYESAGVLRPGGRAANGHRRYLPGDVAWLEFVLRLKKAGMPLAEIKRYAELREQGDPTLQQRLAMLELHRERLAAKMSELLECASALDDKVRAYRGLIARSGALVEKEDPHDHRDPLRKRPRETPRD